MAASQRMSIPMGATFTLERSSNPTTGYIWTILVSPGLELTGDNYQAGSRAVGAGGVQSWTIRATNSGYQYILLWHHRPWLPPVISAEDLISIDVADQKEATSTDGQTLEIEVYFDRGMQVVGFTYQGVDYAADGHRAPAVKAHRSMSFDVKAELEHLQGMNFYVYHDDIFYSLNEDYQMTDQMLCIYDRQARLVGCPSGGLSGRGDGLISNWRQHRSLGSIRIQPRYMLSTDTK